MMRLMHIHINYKITIHLSNTTFHIVPKILMVLKTCYAIHKTYILKAKYLENYMQFRKYNQQSLSVR